jgi:hypothetical protein
MELGYMLIYQKTCANMIDSQEEKLLFYAGYANYERDGWRRHNMAARDTLIFSGRRWPAVRATGKAPMLGRWVRKSAPSQPYVVQFAFVASGDGQQWDADRPMAFWRNFAALDLTDTTEALHFIARHGDPLSHLDRGSRASTSEPWPALMDALDRIADAWEPSDPSGISFVSADRDRLDVARRALQQLAPTDEGGLPDIELIAQDRGLVPRARTLRAFMVASAASALRRGVAMRKCARCNDFFELKRADAVFCSGSCQAADYKQWAMTPGATVLEIAGRKRKGRSHGERA